MPSSGGKTLTVHRSFFFRNMTIGVCQTVITHNIAKGLDIKRLEAAVHRLLDRNPILSGVLRFGDKVTGPGVFVDTHQHDKLVHVIRLPSVPPSPSTCQTTAELTEYVHKYMEPHIPASKNGNEELQ